MTSKLEGNLLAIAMTPTIDAARFICAHGETTGGGPSLDGDGTERIVSEVLRTHAAKMGCDCGPEVVVEYWPDIREAWAIFETDEAPEELAQDAFAMSIHHASVEFLRKHHTCPHCQPGYVRTFDPKHHTIRNDIQHEKDCPDQGEDTFGVRLIDIRGKGHNA